MPQLNDWHMKRDFLFRVFHWADSMPKLVEEMFDGMKFEDPNAIPTFTDTAQRWRNCLKPNTPMAVTFFENIALSLSCTTQVTAVMLMESTYAQFVELVPESNRSDGIGLGPVPNPIVLVEDLSEEEIAHLDDEVLATIDTSMFPIEVFEYDPWAASLGSSRCD